jgi:hypothetical protein
MKTPAFAPPLRAAQPGDTILFHEGTYDGGEYVEGLAGAAGAWIVVRAVSHGDVVIEGGANAWHLTDPSYVVIEDFTFRGQTANGVNTDDGGEHETPAHDIKFVRCVFADISASGNNDLLKMSGVDSFEIRECSFVNGSEGGSGIDMVGCHDGAITGSTFDSQGSNSIQAKGGTRNVLIERNLFVDGGQRAVNLGGSTGLEYFRPLDAPFEAADLQVYSNIFIRSYAPVAYVGCVRVDVANNTIYDPENWVIRILQETVDESRFAPCGQNTFRNNIVVVNDGLSTECNIGPNTDAESFTFSNNLWYNRDNASWTPRDLPVEDENGVSGQDPLFADAGGGDFSIPASSPAAGAGYDLEKPAADFDGRTFSNPRAIGALEVNGADIRRSGAEGPIDSDRSSPAGITCLSCNGNTAAELYSLNGKRTGRLKRNEAGRASPLPAGIAIAVVRNNSNIPIIRCVSIH